MAETCTGPRAMTVSLAHGHRDPARGWTAGLHPTSYFGFWGGSLGWYTPTSGLEIFPWLCYVLRPLGKSATCSFWGSWFSSVWTSRFHCAFWMLASHSALTLPPRCRLGSLEEDLEWSTDHSSNYPLIQYILEHQGCRDQHYMDHIFEEIKNRVGRPQLHGKCYSKGTGSRSLERGRKNHRTVEIRDAFREGVTNDINLTFSSYVQCCVPCNAQ